MHSLSRIISLLYLSTTVQCLGSFYQFPWMVFAQRKRVIATQHHTVLGKAKGMVRFKPIFQQKLGSRWVPNVNEIYTKNMKYTWPTPSFCVGTQRNLYSTDWRWGLALGLTQILDLASGVWRWGFGVGGLASGVWRRVTQIFTF